MIEIVCLPPDQWAEYQDLRLEMLKVERQAFCSRYADALEIPEAEWRSRLARAWNEDRYGLLFAKNEGEIVGMIGLVPGETEGEADIVSFYVWKAARGLGVGRELMSEVLRRAEEDPSINSVALLVNVSQTRAMDLYQQFGFEKVDEVVKIMGDDQEHTEWVMRRVVQSS